MDNINLEYNEYTHIKNAFYIANFDGYIDSVQFFSGSYVPEGLLGILITEDIKNLSLIDENGFFNYKIVNNKLLEVTEDEKQLLKTKKENQLLQQLSSFKKDKIALSKNLLSNFLINNPLISSCHNGEIARYNVTLEKQNLMLLTYNNYQIEKQTGYNSTLKWNATGQLYEEWTEEEFLQLLQEIKTYIEPFILKQQEYEMQINNCTTIEELKAINIIY